MLHCVIRCLNELRVSKLPSEYIMYGAIFKRGNGESENRGMGELGNGGIGDYPIFPLLKIFKRGNIANLRPI